MATIHHMDTQSDNASVGIVVAVLLAALIALGVYYYSTQQNITTMSPMDASNIRVDVTPVETR